jgi:hypothetical protein
MRTNRLVCIALLLAAGAPAADAQQYRILGANDLGMHCIDKEFSVFSILPPFNVVNVQVVKSAIGVNPVLLDDSTVDVTYEAIADGASSYNSTSLMQKTQFWQYAPGLFGVNVPAGMGLTGLWMPADAPVPGPQPLAFQSTSRSFRAFGIPITPVDDALHTNPFPLLRFAARDKQTHALLATIDVVVPVASETDCSSCHATGHIAAEDPSIAWSNDSDLEVQSKRNVLILHDHKQGTHLMASQPVLCASCHISPPLDLGGGNPNGGSGSIPIASRSTQHVGGGMHNGAHPPSQIPLMSKVMHDFHGKVVDPNTGRLVFPRNGTALQTCYKCHPGAITQCLRGAMKTGGMECFQCHGDMLSVGGEYPLLAGGSLDGQNDGKARRPWMDEPRCQSCHTGDALSHLSGPDLVAAPDGIRLRQAWRIGDLSASPLKAVNQRFAEDPNKQYRASKGHGELACEACHGSTHAEWPNADPTANDNVAATEIQGHTGPIIECNACHASLGSTTSGPHGLHNVNSQSFVNNHDHFYESNPAACQACHGANLLGTVLSRAAANRFFAIEDGHTINITKGTQIRCNMCHGMPGSGG